MGAELTDKRQRLRELIERRSLLQNRAFVLSSGRSSGFFFDMKRTLFDPEGAGLVAELLFERIRNEDFAAIGGLETGAIPIVALVCARSWPDKPVTGFFVRKEIKGHGTDQRIDGLLEPGSRVVLVEDVTTTGGSVMQAAEEARRRACDIVKIVTIVDRLEGAADTFARAGIAFDWLYTWRDFN